MGTNITTAAIQARWLAEMLRHGLPSAEEMRSTIEEQKAWKRETMPHAGHARAYMIQTHQVHYYDDLLRDIGASIRRKRGFFKFVKEFFDPYRPGDYDTIVTGSYKVLRGESAKPGSRQCGFILELIELILFIVVVVFVAKF